MSNHNFKKYSGFTLIEMLIVAPMIILVIGVFIGAIINMTGEVMMTRASGNVTFNIQDALDRIETDVKKSGAFLATNNITVVNPQGYGVSGDDTTAFQNSHATRGNALILNSYASSDNPSTSATRNIVYASNQPYSCSDPQVNQNSPVMINIVYFVKQETLWRRTITPSNYTTIGCSIPWQKPSCKPGYTNIFCKTNDIELVKGIDNLVTGFKVEYYSSPSSTTANTVAVDSGQNDATRQTALNSTNTIKATIISNTTIAGRDVSRSGTIRAVTLNNNIKSQLITTQPADATVTAGANASFSAASSGSGATVQWQQSTGKDMNWSNISGATSTSLTVSAVTNTMDGYKYRAIFTKGSDIIYSNSARMTVNQPNLSTSWYTLRPASMVVDIGESTTPWSNYSLDAGSYNTNGYRKTTSGVVILKGLLKKNAAITAGEVIGNLPVSYRPSGNLMFITGTNSNVYCRIDIYPSGNVVAYTGCSNGWVSLEGIKFIADTGRYTENTVTNLSNNWTNYGGSYELASYVVDDIGRVHTQGLVVPGILTNGALIYSLPTNLLPSGYMHIPTVTVNGGFAEFGISGTAGSGILAKGLGLSYISLNAMYYPVTPSPTPTWYNLDLTPATVDWVNYGGQYTTAQCTKASDGLVSLKGLIRSGTATTLTTIARVHASCGYPAKRVLHTAASADAHSRIDIDSAGYIIISTGSATWLSLDGITYYDD